MSKETDNDTSSNTIEMNEIIKTRKKRLSTEEIINYINWALINDNMEMIKNNSLVFVQKSYKEQTGRDTHTHTVCVTYYKAAPYNISHTKIFQWRFSL